MTLPKNEKSQEISANSSDIRKLNNTTFVTNGRSNSELDAI